MADKSIGFIETFGMAAAIAAADAAVKAGNVKLLGFEHAKGDGMCTVKVEGNVGACKAAIEAGKRAANSVNGPLSGIKSLLLKARPADGIKDMLIYNRENVGGDIALAEGYRPKGTSHKAVLVKNWKPKEEPKDEAPIEEAPEPPVVEDLKVEISEEENKPEAVEETPVDETESQPEVKDSVVAPETEESAPVAAPEEEKAEPEADPKQEDVPAAEETLAEKTPAPAEETPAPAEPSVPAGGSSEADAPKKKTSTGNRRSGRSKKKKNSDK